MTRPGTSRPEKSRSDGGRPSAAGRREEILRIAMETFATRGYHNASLAEIAERSGLTQAGVLHHFRSKAGLLTGVLDLRDQSDLAQLGEERPRGLAFLAHLVDTARRNAEREGIVRLYAVLSAESVTSGHPAQEYFRARYAGLRAMVVEAIGEAADAGEVPAGLDPRAAASAVMAVMDGLQVQWLLAPEAVDMAATTDLVIGALLGRPVPGGG
ncbi:TetR/AcrR family transcriptional regulator [Streptomyces sp. MP131-18]|uniref:TetR/AcrR family transcriptional regulator n=1 Tax=Streptomyces sp. MP131-18 TaxID=1857892 RepID=UPI0009D49D06|nr:TetR/AcrR family transcriptional regulator [Streptomyces sp. MP131-18]ONK11352.1 Toluene efflux pump ttgABC operon repressor [Streptomyces sp. MP131-18]